MERKEMEMGVAFSRIERLEELERVQLLAQQIWPETYKEILTEEQISYMMEMMYSSSVLEKEFAE
ncbi:MAG: hypothetical protein IKA79_01680, partial [Lentisphaeria bacterium]|nr:hypothetical protein [Lentisphaeria bacterium]